MYASGSNRIRGCLGVNLAVTRLARLRELLANPSAIHEATALLAEQVEKPTLERVDENGKIRFKANGQIDFLCEEELTQLSGAGGPIESVRSFEFSLPIVA